MKRRKKTDGLQENHEPQVDVGRLVKHFRQAVDHRDSNYWDRMRANYEARYCIWPNQTWDGKKWKSARGKKPFPWLGASDARVPLVDKYLREDLAILMQAWINQRIRVRPTRTGTDEGWANRITALLRWQVYEQMEETEEEAELLGNYMLERGAAALAILWCKEERNVRESVTFEQIDAGAQRARQLLLKGNQSDALALQASLPGLIMDPAAEDDVAGIIRDFLGDDIRMDLARARRVVRDLRTNGHASFPRVTVAKNRPIVRALRWNDEILVPPGIAANFQQSPRIFMRELLSETELETRARSYGYDRNWVDWMIETQRGRVSTEATDHAQNRSSSLGLGQPDLADKDRFEVVTAYERLYDDDGIAGLWMTPFSPASGKDSKVPGYALHQLIDYAHGEFPVVPFSVEMRSRNQDDSRGYGERAFSLQQQIKRQWDARTDRADASTLPPSYYPPDEEPTAWGPGVKIPTGQPQAFGYFDPPRQDNSSEEVEDTVRAFCDEYFGRPINPENQLESSALRRDMVRGWFRGWKRAFAQILKLDQQYLPDEVWVAVVGNGQGQTMRVGREQIQGEFSLRLEFNAQDIDAKYVAEKIALFRQALELDVNGRIDRDEALLAAMELVDPSYVDRLVKPGESATLEQVDDEQTILLKLLAGIPVDVRGNEAFGLRKQVLIQTIQRSPQLQQIMQANPAAAKMIQTRVQQLDFNIAQKMENPEIGRRLGSKPMAQVQSTMANTATNDA